MLPSMRLGWTLAAIGAGALALHWFTQDEDDDAPQSPAERFASVVRNPAQLRVHIPIPIGVGPAQPTEESYDDVY